jgi:hypothetical protein
MERGHNQGRLGTESEWRTALPEKSPFHRLSVARVTSVLPPEAEITCLVATVHLKISFL